jgi:hypothetical protein
MIYFLLDFVLHDLWWASAYTLTLIKHLNTIMNSLIYSHQPEQTHKKVLLVLFICELCIISFLVTGWLAVVVIPFSVICQVNFWRWNRQHLWQSLYCLWVAESISHTQEASPIWQYFSQSRRGLIFCHFFVSFHFSFQIWITLSFSHLTYYSVSLFNVFMCSDIGKIP